MPERFLGQTLGERYRLTRLLGAGAYAWVYEAVDTELEIVVAVKVLRPEHTGNDTVEARFRREATTAARLRHPNIVTVRDVGRGNGVTWVAMDLVPTSLARRLQVLPYLPETDVVRVGLDVAGALAMAHADQVIHRDIKPDNILIGASGESIVCDFGLARALSGGADLSATNQVLGTPHYFSPEQARGEPLDGRSDLYTLGVTLYRAATGRLPFEGDDWYAVARQHVDATPVPPRKHVPALSPAFEAIILKLLAKRPGDRYPSAMALADALARLPSAPTTGSRLALGAGDATTAHTITPGGRTRRRALVLLGSAALVALAVWLARERPRVRTAWALLTRAAATADSGRTVPDTLTGPGGGDSLQRPVTGADSTAVTTIPNVTPPTRPRPAPRTGWLSVVAGGDAASLTVDGQNVGFAPWLSERLPAGQHIIASTLTGGEGVFVGCRFNQRVDTITVGVGDTTVHTVDLGRCTRVWLDVTPRDARVTFLEADGTTVLSGNADRLSPAVLRAGGWRLRVEARACAPFEGVDTLVAGADTVRVALLCG